LFRIGPQIGQNVIDPVMAHRAPNSGYQSTAKFIRRLLETNG
jgi:hypothetical protein